MILLSTVTWLTPIGAERQAVMYEGLKRVLLIGCIRANFFDAMHLTEKVGDEMMADI